MINGFQLDPREVLGVGTDASPEKIREAYYQQSKKHHPDQGGDEWAFRVVAHAYEILKTAQGPFSQAIGGSAGTCVAQPTVVDETLIPEPAIRQVNVELHWFRFDTDGREATPDRELEDTTLSVCLLISWPPMPLADHPEAIPGSAEILRNLIRNFERLQEESPRVSSRSRIEDGRFVGWVSYPDVLKAELAVEFLREALKTDDLRLRLSTRAHVVPRDPS